MRSFAAAHLGYDTSAAPTKRVRGRLSPDVWYLIFQLLAIQNRHDLFNLCLTSREFYFLATPALYRTVVFAAPCAPLIGGGARGRNGASRSALDSLLCRLSDEKCDIPRIYVREVVLSHLDAVGLETLWGVINRLPNVRNVILKGPVYLPGEVVEGLSAHPRRPTLELLDQDGTTMVMTALPQARSLQAVVDLGWGINEAPNRLLLDLQRLLFSCPNLRSLSLTTVDQHSGCALRHLMFPTISNFKLTGEEIFPPIEELTLNGYQIRHMEWPHWRDHFPWSGLSSLTLGPQPDLHTLGLMTGFAKSIHHLKLSAYSDEEQIRPGDIDRFLLSFDTLISLEIRGLFYSVHAVANHPNLTTVRLHAFELTPGQRAELGIRSQRKTLTVQDLGELDSRCPYIQELELDCNRHGGQWPRDILAILASRFHRLRRLSIHLELGVSNLNIPLAPVLSATTAQAIGREFLAMRGHGRLQRLTLKTGEPLRRFPGGDPLHRRWEQVHAATFEIQPARTPSQPVHVVHVEREVLEGRRDLSEIDRNNLVDLRVRVQAAIDGPGMGMQEDEAETGPGRRRHGGLEVHRVARETRMIPV